MVKSCRATKMIIDTEKIKRNIQNIKNYIGKDVELLPVIKANGYGTYINEKLDILNEFKIISVSLVDEAIHIRNIGYKGNILVLYPIREEEIEDALKNDLILNACNIDILKKINNITNKKVKVHIEVETGMGRTGVQISLLDDYIKELKILGNIEVEGVFSHFSSSSKDLEFSKIQIKRFEKALEVLKSYNINPKYTHICNSGAIFTYKNSLYNMVRIGIMLYGYYPNPKFEKELELYPAITLKTKINYIKTIDIGDTVGYNKSFTATRKSRIATIPFGFGDGLISLSMEKSFVIVNGKSARILGICMDNMMIDITDIENVNYDTDVFIWDNNNLAIDGVAEWCFDLCNYEILCSISERVPRYFI